MTERHSLKSMFDRYYTDLLRFVSSKYGNRQDSEDIVQDAFCNILKSGKADSLDNARAYLYRTANNLALNRIEKEKHHYAYSQQNVLNENTITPESTISAYKELEQVDSALDSVAAKYRRTFTLSRVHSMSYKEISQELGIPVPTVEKHIIKVLKHLRQQVKRP